MSCESEVGAKTKVRGTPCSVLWITWIPLSWSGKPVASLWGSHCHLPALGRDLRSICQQCDHSRVEIRSGSSYLSGLSQASLRVTYPQSEPEAQSCKSLPVWLCLLTWVMAGVLCRVGLFNLEPNYQIMAYVLHRGGGSLIRLQGFQISGNSWQGRPCHGDSTVCEQTPSTGCSQLTAMELYQ